MIAVGSLTGLIAPMPSPAQPSRPEPPPAPIQRFDPDASTCRPEELESGFRRQLLPWADQSEAVLNRLRQVQAEMLRASLRRCQQRGLLTPDQALGVEQRLKLPPAEAPP
ncbi:MAG: hypothetical protein ACKOBY_11980 [Cyanobium sp.]